MAACTGAACSLTRKGADCQDTTECRVAFGTGYVCQKSGTCELAPIERRCQYQTPEGLLLSPEFYQNHVVFGSLLRAQGKEGARQDAVLLALQAVNDFLAEHGPDYPGLSQLRFGMVQCNHDGDVREVAALADYLVGVLETPVILGPATSSATQSTFERINLDAEGNELRRSVLMSPSATSVALTGLESIQPGFLWRTAPTDDAQARLMGEYVMEHKLSFMALYEDTPYGRGLYDELRAATKRSCDTCGFSFDASTANVASLAATLATDRALQALDQADVVFFMGAQESHLDEMVSRLPRPEFEGKVLFLSDAGASTDTVSQVRDQDVGRVLGTRPRGAEDGEPFRVFSSIYSARHEESPRLHSFTAHAHDAAWLVLLAALRAQLVEARVDAATIADGLRRLNAPDWRKHSSRDCPTEYRDRACLPITLDATQLPIMLDALLRWDAIDVRGASGSLDYDNDREELVHSSDAFELWHLEPGDDDSGPTIVSTPPMGILSEPPAE